MGLVYALEDDRNLIDSHEVSPMTTITKSNNIVNICHYLPKSLVTQSIGYI